MKIMKLLVVVAVGAFLFLGGMTSHAQGNLVKNGNFSESTSDGLPLHWNAHKSPLQAKGQQDRKIFLSAPASLRLENPTEGNRTRFLQNFTTIPGKEYIFSFYIKGKGISGTGKKIGARAMMLHESGRWITGGSLDGLWKQKKGTFNWEKCEFKFISPPGNGKLRIRLVLLDAKGTVWFDDISVNEVTKKVKMSEEI